MCSRCPDLHIAELDLQITDQFCLCENAFHLPTGNDCHKISNILHVIARLPF